MTYKTFDHLYAMACGSRDFNEFAERAKDYEDLAMRGILFSIWLFSVDHTSTKIRDFSGLSRAAFCRTYGLQERTVTNWDTGKTYPPDWALNLLCYAVLEEVLEKG